MVTRLTLMPARAYLASQSIAGAVWWVAVFSSDDVRRWTLGRWDPQLLVVPDLVLFVGASGFAAVRSSRTAALVCTVWTVGVTLALSVFGLIEREAGWGVVAMVCASAGSLAATSVVWWGHVPLGWFFVGPFHFRPAPQRAAFGHLRRALAQLVVFWSAFFVAVPVVLAWLEERLRIDVWSPSTSARQIAVAAFGVFSALGLWSCVSMSLRGEGTPLPAATARRLVISGPYRSVRNPMAVAGAVQTSAIGTLVGAWSVVVIAIVGAFVWDTFIRPTEEADLAARFGREYDAYRAAVRCWIPSRPFTLPGAVPR